MLLRKFLFFFLLGFLFFSSVAAAEIQYSAHTKAELVSDVASIRPGEVFWVALRLEMDKSWHTYWKNPGDSGLATSIRWRLPNGFTAGEIKWPHPLVIKVPPLVTYGYEGEVFLLTEIRAPNSLTLGNVEKIAAEVQWLACQVNCIPGKARLSLSVSVSEHVKANPEWAKIFSQTRSERPLLTSEWDIKVLTSPDNILLKIKNPPHLTYNITKIYLFPDNASWIKHAAEQRFVKTETGYELLIERSSLSQEPIARVSGVLVAEEGWRGLGSERALALDSQAEQVPVLTLSPTAKRPMSVAIAILFAFLGGLILNLMPCVLPVLSLKVIGFVEQEKLEKSSAWKHGLLFAGGILISFWILAGVLIALRAGGERIGWGFQLQSPVFLIFLIILFFVFALNLFGIFELAVSLTAFAGKARIRKGQLGSFLNGVLATVVATPCTAPFMGSALGFALTQSNAASFVVFSALGLGMGFPFLVLSFFPALLAWVPKPGPWMIGLKRVLAVFLLATVIWLLWIFALQAGIWSVVSLLAMLFAISLVLWNYGMKHGFVEAAKRKSFLIIVFLLLVIFGSGIYTITHKSWGEYGVFGKSKIDWKPFSLAAREEALTQGQPVFIDFTAAWCLTCKVNDAITFESKEVAGRFKRLGVVALKADWTLRDESVTEALAQYGRTSIPLYVYHENAEKPALFLPELLTPGIVLEMLPEDKPQ